jgi:hypothetical protein
MSLAIFDLNGVWAAGGETGPRIQTTNAINFVPPDFQPDPDGKYLVVDMSAYPAIAPPTNANGIKAVRPQATGVIQDATHISLNFPDDRTHTAELIAGNPSTGTPDTIVFDNNSSWTRVANFWGGETLIPLQGRWASNGTPGPFIGAPTGYFTYPIDMSAYNQPAAHVSVLLWTDETPSFASLLGLFEDASGSDIFAVLKGSPPSIAWYNGTVWTFVPPSWTTHLSKNSDGPLFVIDGKDFPGNRILLIKITSPDQATLNFEDQITTNSDGTFVYNTLPAWRPSDRLVISIGPQVVDV